MSRAAAAAGLLAGLVLLAHGRDAQAYPQFQFSTGTQTCSQCHYSPTGGGLITSWGRDESGDTISLGGDGAFLHGLWTPPSWLALGLDVRLATTRNDVGGPEAPEVAYFPMQGDFYGRVAFSDAFSLNVTLGARSVVRPADDSLSGQLSTLGSRFISREHYLMWRPSAQGPYARIGRFYVPYGIRFVEHVYFVRRYNGLGLYEETYNASGGYQGDDWDLHATAFMPVPSGFPDALGGFGLRAAGAAAMGERRFNKMAAVGAQARVSIADQESRYQGGLVGKLWIDEAHLLFMGQGDFIRQQIKAADFGQNQFVSYLGATFFVRGLMVGAAYERFQSDLSVRGTARNAYDLQVNFFPWAHFELFLFGRYQKAAVAGDGAETSAGKLLMLQLHYYM